MGFQLQPNLVSYGVPEDLTWLTHFGDDVLQVMDSITLDSTTLAAAFPPATGTNLVVVKSGTLLAQITATGKYGPFDPTASDGRQLTTNIGFLGATSQLNRPGSAGAVFDVSAPLLWRGSVSLSKLAAATGITTGPGFPTSGAQTALKLVRFVA